MAEGKVYRFGHNFDTGDGRDRFNRMRNAFEAASYRSTSLYGKEDVHPDMPYDADLLNDLEDMAEMGGVSVDRIDWYQLDSENIQELSYNEDTNDLVAFEDPGKRDMAEKADEMLNVYAIDGFTGCKLIGDEKPVNIARRFLAEEGEERHNSKADNSEDEFIQDVGQFMDDFFGNLGS